MIPTFPKRRPMVTALALLLCLNGCGSDDGTPSAPVAVDQPVAIVAGAPNAVSFWSDIAVTTSNATSTVSSTAEEQNPVYSADLATVHVAMYDAATAIDGRYKAFATTPTTNAAGASIPAAVSAAAYGVLKGLYPDRGDQYGSAYTTYIAGITDGDAKTRGLALGAEVAAATLALRANDGRMTTFAPFVPGTTPGAYRGPSFVYPFAGFMKPFTLKSVSQFRPAGPPALTSTAYATDVNEVKTIGSATSTARTADQTDKALFWNEFPGMQFPRNFVQFAKSTSDVAEAARLMAFIYVVQADSTLACFEAKYVFYFWRPDSAITLADTDNNPLTVADPTFTPEIPTPPHPEYPAGHLCYGVGFAETLHQYYGTRNVSFAFDSMVTNGTHQYASTDAFASELQIARIAGGIHFRFSTVDGQALGVQVAQYVAQNYFGKR